MEIVKDNFSVNPDMLRLYRNYQYLRTDIYRKRELQKLEKPWVTGDDILSHILKTSRFTNTKREIDTQSKYLINNVIKNDKLTVEDKALNCLLFRIINSELTVGRIKDFPVVFSEFMEDKFQEYVDYERQILKR